MRNVRINWNLPTTRLDGRPLPPADLAATLVLIRVEGAPSFTPLAEVPAPTTEFVQTELDPGTYHFRLQVVDRQTPPKASPPVDLEVTIDAAQPGPVTDATIVRE